MLPKSCKIVQNYSIVCTFVFIDSFNITYEFIKLIIIIIDITGDRLKWSCSAYYLVAVDL